MNDIAKRLLLETNTVTPLLQRMEKEGFLVRRKGEKDARQMIVSLTEKGRELQKKLAETAPELFRMLDGIIGKLSAPSTRS